VTTGCIRRALLAGALFVSAAVCFADTVRVALVLDGDSLRLTDGREVRLIGINTPEHGKDGKAEEPLAREARVLLKRLVEGKEIRLAYDHERQDRYRRTLAHAFLSDGTSVQQAMLGEGLAVVIAIPPNLAHLDRYLRAETEARRMRRGVWGDAFYQPRDVRQLGAHDTGFHFVSGRVQRVGRSRFSIYLDLDDRFALAIPQQHWYHFGGDPKRFIGKHVIARGWVTAQENRLRLRLSHPAMLQLID
jgi:endonuclease YncB( thermonuclease family)